MKRQTTKWKIPRRRRRPWLGGGRKWWTENNYKSKHKLMAQYLCRCLMMPNACGVHNRLLGALFAHPPVQRTVRHELIHHAVEAKCVHVCGNPIALNAIETFVSFVLRKPVTQIDTSAFDDGTIVTTACSHCMCG